MRQTHAQEEGAEFYKAFRELPKKLDKIGRKQKRERKRIMATKGEGIASVPAILNATRITMARSYNQTGKALSASKIPFVKHLGDFSQLAAETSLTNGENIVEDPSKVGRLLSAGLIK